MKKIILAIVVIIVLGGGVYAHTKISSKNNQPTEQPTINLMGIEMTKQQAEEHCALMPTMDGCAPYIK